MRHVTIRSIATATVVEEWTYEVPDDFPEVTATMTDTTGEEYDALTYLDHHAATTGSPVACVSVVNGEVRDEADREVTSVTDPLADVIAHAKAAQDAAHGDSNDTEIDALRLALETALDALGIPMPEAGADRAREACAMFFEGRDTDGTVWSRCTVHGKQVLGDMYVCEGYEPPPYTGGH